MFGADASPADIDALRDEDGRLPPDAFRRLRQAPTAKRGPGRPLGSVNKRSEKLAKLVIQEFGDPVLGAASLYAQPLDQLCEMLLVADGSAERDQRMEAITGELVGQVNELGAAIRRAAKTGQANDLTKAVDRLADAAESLEAMRKAGGKAGGLALQALNVQLMARKFVGEYVHSKRPVAVDVTHRSDGLLVMPGLRGSGAGSEESALVQQELNRLLKSGQIEADQVARLVWKDGRLHDPDGEIAEAEFVEVEGDDDGD
jgi:hypothetical protein